MRRKEKENTLLSPHCIWRPIATQPPRVSSSTLYRLKVDSVGYIFAADSFAASIFFQIFVVGSERRTIDIA